jgi:hypothetical protein
MMDQRLALITPQFMSVDMNKIFSGLLMTLPSNPRHHECDLDIPSALKDCEPVFFSLSVLCVLQAS